MLTITRSCSSANLAPLYVGDAAVPKENYAMLEPCRSSEM